MGPVVFRLMPCPVVLRSAVPMTLPAFSTMPPLPALSWMLPPLPLRAMPALLSRIIWPAPVGDCNTMVRAPAGVAGGGSVQGCVRGGGGGAGRGRLGHGGAGGRAAVGDEEVAALIERQGTGNIQPGEGGAGGGAARSKLAHGGAVVVGDEQVAFGV